MICHGQNFIKGDYVIIRDSSNINIGNNVRISDYCRITVPTCILGDYVEIAPMCSISGGGPNHKFVMEGYSSLASGAKIWLSSNDYVNELVTHGLDGVKELQGSVILERFTGIGCNSVVMPNNYIPEGVTIGALSFVPEKYEFTPWTVYAGCPIRPIKKRDKYKVLRNLSHLL